MGWPGLPLSGIVQLSRLAQQQLTFSPIRKGAACSAETPLLPLRRRAAFLPYLQSEMVAVNDSSLQQEVDLLNTLIAV